MAKKAWLWVGVLLLAAGAILIAASFFPYERLKTVADAISKDGDMASFSRLLWERALLFVRLWGAGWLGLGALNFLFPQTAQRLAAGGLGRAGGLLLALPGDARRLAAALRPNRRQRVYLFGALAVTLLALGSGLLFLSQPMRYDESYTVLVFAMRPFHNAISDYHLPNNHVFHTALVYLAYHLLGNQPWVVRLPAFLAGILSIPACYLVARMLYGPAAGLLSAALLATSSVLIDFSTNARGYTLVTLFSLLVLGLAVYLRYHKNLAGWGLLVVFSALGFYTIPIMLYPFGIVMLWLLLSALAGDISPAYHGMLRFLAYLCLAGILTALLAAFLYLPVIRVNGLGAVTGNRFVSSMEWGDFTENVLVRLRNTWADWMRDQPPLVEAFLAAGLLGSLVLHRKAANHRVPIPLAALLWVGTALMIQKVAPWPRVWLFLLPLVFMWAAAGLLALFKGFLQANPRRETAFVLGVTALAVLLSANMVRSLSANTFKHPGSRGEAEDAALFLRDRLKPGDTVAVVVPTNYPTRYYFSRYGISLKYWCGTACPPDFQRAFVVVTRRDGQTLENVAERVALTRTVDLSRAQAVHKYASTTIYEIDRGNDP